MTPDEITLIIPRERALFGVAHLVLGGLGIRLNLTIEHLEDMQLALETLLLRWALTYWPSLRSQATL